MSIFYDIIESIASTTSKTKKLATIEDVNSLSDSVVSDFKRIVEYTYSPFYSYDLIKFNDKPDYYLSSIGITDVFDVLEALNSRELTGKAAIEFVEELLPRLSEKDASLFTRIIRRDLRCGASASSFNKVWPQVVYDPPYQRCTSFSIKAISKIPLPCVSEVKADGMYVDIVVTNDNVSYRSRTGHPQPLGTPERDKFLLEHANTDGRFVLMGEAVVVGDDGKFLSREEGNGYLNSGDVDPSKVHFVLWDCVPLLDYHSGKCKVSRSIRVDRMKFICANNRITLSTEVFITPVESKVCKTVDDIIDHFRDAVRRGEEGTVVKATEAIWKNGTSTQQVKIKIVAEGELLVTGVKEGEGRLKGMCGALICQSSCGEVIVSVAGLSDALRKKFFKEQHTIVSHIITVRYNDVLYSETKKCWSLFLPRYVETRNDKTVADTRIRLIEQLDSAIDALREAFA